MFFRSILIKTFAGASSVFPIVLSFAYENRFCVVWNMPLSTSDVEDKKQRLD